MALLFDRVDLDNYITGHYGEDQLRDSEECGCPNCGGEIVRQKCVDCGYTQDDAETS